jgi:hypothetical protein
VAYLVDRHSFYDHLKMQFIHDVHHDAIPEEVDGVDNVDNVDNVDKGK